MHSCYLFPFKEFEKIKNNVMGQITERNKLQSNNEIMLILSLIFPKLIRYIRIPTQQIKAPML